MKTIFDKDTRSELIRRVGGLTMQSKALWGVMDAYQMLKHCTLNEEVFQERKHYKRLFIGRLFGKMTLHSILKNGKPMKKNQPTHPELKIKGTGDFEAEKEKWCWLLEEYGHYATTGFIHPFFGKMTREQVGRFVYKHTDHHLRQFGQ